jgi:septal ring factor EnvC (AmiA/AmiB activator)
VGIQTIAAAGTARAAPISRRWASRRTLALLLAVAVGASCIAVATNLWLGRRAEIARTIDAADATHAQLRRTQDELALAREGLRTATAVLDDAQTTLATKKTERDAAAAALAAAGTKLTDLRALLARATADLNARKQQLGILDQCLLGVAQALNQAGVGDLAGLARTIGGIAGTCTQAGAAL